MGVEWTMKENKHVRLEDLCGETGGKVANEKKKKKKKSEMLLL